jgi:hypothetical protein
MTSWPFSAGSELPDTGASTKVTPRWAASVASRWVQSTPMVLIWIHTAPGDSTGSAPAGPVIACATAAPSASMVISTSAPSAAAAGWGAWHAPWATSASALAGVRFHTRTAYPARSRLRAMGAPIVPVPRTASVVIARAPGSARRPASPRP